MANLRGLPEVEAFVRIEEEEFFMKRLLLCALLGVFVIAPAMFADVVDFMLNVNGTTYCDSGTGATCDVTGSLPGNVTTDTLDTTFGGTGLGTVSLTFGAGTYNVGLWLFEELNPLSGYDEYGATGGSLGAGESWQIDTPDYDYVNGFDPNFGGLAAGAGSIVANTTAGSLADTNYLPGNSDAYDVLCSGSPTCNDFASGALAYNFTVSTGTDTLSFTQSTTKPTSGFFLEQIAPVDGINLSEIDYYYTATLTANTCTVDCSPVPEPSSLIPMLAFAGVLVFLVWRRRTAAV